MLDRIIRFFNRHKYVSEEWLYDNALRSTKIGWEGPRWKTPKELKKERRLLRMTQRKVS